MAVFFCYASRTTLASGLLCAELPAAMVGVFSSVFAEGPLTLRNL
jgi:hypothetical protein